MLLTSVLGPLKAVLLSPILGASLQKFYAVPAAKTLVVQ
jgi:hypothetical protein